MSIIIIGLRLLINFSVSSKNELFIQNFKYSDICDINKECDRFNILLRKYKYIKYYDDIAKEV